MYYFVELETNESEAFADEGMTANFSVPEKLREFKFFTENMEDACKIAFGYLQGLTETPFNEIDYHYFNEETAAISFANYEDGLGITYNVRRETPRPYHFVDHLPQEFKDLVVWRLKENGITDPDDVDHAINSRVSSLEDAIDITDIFCGEPIEKCTFCGKVDFATTRTVGGYTILSTCESCETDILK